MRYILIVIYLEIKMASSNPLAKHFRQPKLYVTLPSRGIFYNSNEFETSETGEIAVYAMTAKDELKFKTPDALLNGQATVDVIQSCIPAIKNAWRLASIDLDAVLIAIRIATYGEKMDVSGKIPNTEIERTYSVDLRLLLDQLNQETFDNLIKYNDFEIEIEPLRYKSFTEISLKTFEEQRIFALLNNDGITDEERIEKFNESFQRLTNLNFNIVIDSIKSVKIEDSSVSNKEYIAEFFENADGGLFKQVLSHIDAQRRKFNIKPFEITTTEEDRAAGAPESYSLPIIFDQSHFFG